MKEYYVASNGDQPQKIFFNAIDAFVSGFKYIDLFDEAGEHVEAYKFVDNEYTNDF